MLRPASNPTKQHSKVPVIAGSIIGTLVILGILAALLIFLVRRRRHNDENKQWTFHQDMMVQRSQQPVAPASASSIYSASTHPEDLEQGPNTLPTVVPFIQRPIPDAKPRIPDPVVYPTRWRHF